MDFKNFIDILSTPKNIGSNKWVLNNFSDLKSSNDYLHIIRLRYDNRWLKAYWDGKLKEVEKDQNFYVSTPLKNKLFLNTKTNQSGVKLLDTNLTNNLKLNNINNVEPNTYNFNEYFTKQTKKTIEDGGVRNIFQTNDLSNFYNTPSNGFKINDVFNDYSFVKSYFSKNVKNIVKSTEDLNTLTDLWSLSRNNNVSRVYPNNSKILLSGNLLLSSKESEGGFNTNLVSIRNPSWSAIDRYFLSFSKKNAQDLIKINSSLEKYYLNGDFKSFLTNKVFFQNSDHSDMNR